MAIAIQGCAEPDEELHIESSDPIAKSESALEIEDLTLPAPLPLCTQISGTYDYAP
ncbi:MAG TPA: hypothetical protein VFX59_19095 [Polyangiales bacterium]|nr:hypothetical protein [Polyangiales bacterium]